MAIPELGDPKDPAAVRDYTCDWSADLAEGEEIITSTWSIVPEDFGAEPLTVQSSVIDDDGAVTRVFLQGGVAGCFYQVANSVTTTANPTADTQRFILFVQER